MAKVKLSKKPRSILMFYKGKKILSRFKLTYKLTPREIIELEVIHMSVKTHVSR